MTGYIYLIHEREFINSKQYIYKLGKTEQQGCRRFNNYPKHSVIKIILQVHNCSEIEKSLLQTFDTQFINKKEIGREYYEGNCKIMIQEICKYIPSDFEEIKSPILDNTEVITLLENKLKDIFKRLKEDIFQKFFNCYRIYEIENLYKTYNIGLFDIGDCNLHMETSVDFKKLFIYMKNVYDKPTKNKKISCENYNNFVGINNTIVNITNNVEQYEQLRIKLNKYGKKYIKIIIPNLINYNHQEFHRRLSHCYDFKYNGHLFKGSYPF